MPDELDLARMGLPGYPRGASLDELGSILPLPQTGLTNRFVDPNHPLTQALADKLTQYGDYYSTPGTILSGRTVAQPETPGQWSDVDEARAQLTSGETRRRANIMSLDAVTGGLPFAQQGAAGIFGGKLWPFGKNEAAPAPTPSPAAPPAGLFQQRPTYSGMAGRLDQAMMENNGVGFPAVFAEVKALSGDEIKQAAKDWGITGARSEADALSKIWNKYQQLEIMRAKLRATDGRSAG